MKERGSRFQSLAVEKGEIVEDSVEPRRPLSEKEASSQWSNGLSLKACVGPKSGPNVNGHKHLRPL